MSVAFQGKWVQTERSHIDDLLNIYGVPEERKEGARKNMQEQTMELQISGDSGVMINTSPAGSQTMNFTLGQPFEYVMTSGRKVQGVVTKVSDTKIQLELSDPADAKFKATSVSEVNGDDITMDFTVGPVTSVAKYKRS